MRSTTAIIMASTVTADPALARYSPNGSKSLIPINGRPAVSYLIDNLRACEHIDRVLLVSRPGECDSVTGADCLVDASHDEAQSVMAGVRAACDSHRCIIMTGDLPLASCDAITDLLTYAPDSDVVYPVVEQADVKDVFPGREAYYVGTKEGRFTGSSSLLVRPSVALSKEKLITDVLNARHNPTALLGMLGPGMAMKMMFSKPAIIDFESQLSRALGAQCRVFVSHYPELVCSIDSPDDIRFMEGELG